MLDQHWGKAGFPGGRGTIATCTLQGTLLQIGVSSLYYGAAIAMYYVFVITYNLKEETIARYIEPVFHIVIWIHSFSFHITGKWFDWSLS